MKMKLLVGAGIVLGIAACVSTNATLIDPSVHFDRTCPAAVKLYTSSDQILTPYTRVALLDSHGKSEDGTTDADMIRSMRKEAAHLGANGLLLEPIEDPGALVTIIGQVAKTGTQMRARATAIYVPADSAKTRSTCTPK